VLRLQCSGKKLSAFYMASRRYKNRIYRFLYDLGNSPIELFKVLQFLALGWVLLDTLIGFGGFLAYGEPMVGVSVSLLVLAGLHALTNAFRQEQAGIDWELLLPVPFLVYAWAHMQFLSPTPWEAGLFLTVFVQAYALYFIVFTSMHGIQSGFWILSICQTVILVALLAGFFQFYQFPEWMVTLDRERNPLYLDGAAGLLLDPTTLGSVLLLALPASVFILFLRRFPGPVRMLNGFLVFALFVGFLLSTHRPGIAVLAGVLVLLPFFLSNHWRARRRLWMRGLIVLLLLMPAFWFATDALRSRLSGFWTPTEDLLASASLSVAWQRFLESPILGEGLGSFAYLWETFVPEGVEGTALYPASAYADLLSAMGLAGLILILIPVSVLFGRGFSVWCGVPFVTVNKDVAERMKRFPVGHPGRERLERTQGRAPSSKVILGSLLIGLGGYLVYIGWGFSHRLPFHLFLTACLLGALAVFSRRVKRAKVSRAVGLITGLIPLLLVVWAFNFGVPRFYAQHLVYTTDEKLEYLLTDPDRIFIDPGVVTPLLQSYQSASELDPSHAGAWLGLGRARLAQLYAELWPADELAAEARPALEEALERAPESWLVHYELARVLAMLEDSDSAKRHLRRSLELAPRRAEPRAFLGSLLLLRNASSTEGRELVEAALAINPEYEPAQNAMRRIDLNSRQESPSGTGLAFDVFSERLLAQQFEVISNTRERILAAGIMPAPEETLPTPEG
jgi:hypothetical protein